MLPDTVDNIGITSQTQWAKTPSPNFSSRTRLVKTRDITPWAGGGFAKRMVYSVSRLAITRNNYNANNTINLAEIVGAGAAAGVSTLYYPSAYDTWTKTGQKWLVQLAVDGLGNVSKEFWPDINAHVFKNKFW